MSRTFLGQFCLFNGKKSRSSKKISEFLGSHVVETTFQLGGNGGGLRGRSLVSHDRETTYRNADVLEGKVLRSRSSRMGTKATALFPALKPTTIATTRKLCVITIHDGLWQENMTSRPSKHSEGSAEEAALNEWKQSA